MQTGGEGTELGGRTELHADVITPADPGYDEARRIWNGLVDKHPAMIVRCRSTADVVLALSFAREHGLPIAVRGGGHNVAGRCLVDDGLVIDLGAMRQVSVDPDSRTVVAGGGARLCDIDAATAPHHLAVPLGLVGATGVAGFTLHGGYGWLARRHGLALDNLLAVELVTAEGQVLRASEDENDDLFWAVRGGGGNFGVVTSFVFRAHPVADPVWMTVTFYGAEDAPETLERLAVAAQEMPEEVGMLGTLWSLGHEAPVPESARGAPVLGVLACYDGPAGQGPQVTGSLRKLGRVVLDLSGPLRFPEVQRFLDADYPDGRLYYWKSIYLPRMTDDVHAALADAAATRPSPRSSVDVWYLGGAVGRVPSTATAFSHRSSPYLIGIEACWDEPEASHANIEWARRLYSRLEPLSSGETYLNFAGFGEDGRSDLMRAAYGVNEARLREVKRRYDPGNVFRSNFNVSP